MQAKITQYPETFDRVDHVKQVTGEDILRGDDQLWILGEPLIAEVSDGTRIEVAKGFTTDGASVPPIAQWLTGWTKWDLPQRYPAIVHDWLYCTSGVHKLWADRVFRALLESEGASWWQRNAMFAAVLVGGWKAYGIDQDLGPKIYE